MRLVQHNTIVAPISWNDTPCGTYCRQALEQDLKVWWSKLFGFYLLKIGALSADLNTGDCAISYQVNVGLEGERLHVIADPYRLPFANKSVDACLLAHTLSYTNDPYQLLQEMDRVLINDGWLVITILNLMSIMRLSKIRLKIRLSDWLKVLNFEILHRADFQIFPLFSWQRKVGQLNTYFPTIGSLSLIIARKRAFPISLIPLKTVKVNMLCSNYLSV